MKNKSIKKEQVSIKEKINELKRMWKIDETFKRGAYFISNPDSLLNPQPLKV